MQAVLDKQRFSSDEVAALDRHLSALPRAHLRLPYGIRELRREPYLLRDGRSYPTVMGLYSAETGSALLYDGAFRGHFSRDTETIPLPAFAVHALVGCSLAQEPDVYAAWQAAARRDVGAPALVLLLEKAQVDQALQFEKGRLTLDLESLPAGVDLAVGYAAYASFGEQLKAGMPPIYQFFYVRLFERRDPSGGERIAIPRLVRG